MTDAKARIAAKARLATRLEHALDGAEVIVRQSETVIRCVSPNRQRLLNELVTSLVGERDVKHTIVYVDAF
jgi:hypothetical protein